MPWWRLRRPRWPTVNPKCPKLLNPKPPATKWVKIGHQAEQAEVMLVGDSHAQCLVAALDQALQKSNLSGAYWVAPGTLPALGVKTSEHSEKFDRLLAKVAASNVRVVVLSSKWLGHLKTLPHPDGPDKPSTTQQQHLDGLAKTIATLTQAGKKIILVHPFPVMTRQVPEYMVQRLKTGQALAAELTTSERYLTVNGSIMAVLRQMQPQESIRHVYPHELMMAGGHLAYQEDGMSLYEDSHHVTRLGAEKIVKGIIQALQP